MRDVCLVGACARTAILARRPGVIKVPRAPPPRPASVPRYTAVPSPSLMAHSARQLRELQQQRPPRQGSRRAATTRAAPLRRRSAPRAVRPRRAAPPARPHPPRGERSGTGRSPRGLRSASRCRRTGLAARAARSPSLDAPNTPVLRRVPQRRGADPAHPTATTHPDAGTAACARAAGRPPPPAPSAIRPASRAMPVPQAAARARAAPAATPNVAPRSRLRSRADKREGVGRLIDPPLRECR